MVNKSFGGMRLRNAESIVQVVRQKTEISRADLARETALSPATVSSIVEDLIESGFLVETGARSTLAGRRPIGLVFAPACGIVGGISIDDGKLVLALCNLDGKVAVEKIATIDPESDAAELSEQCLKLIRSSAKGSGLSLQGLGAIGLAVRAPLNAGYNSNNGRNRAQIYASLKDQLSKKLSTAVYLDTLVNMAALAENTIGAGQGSECTLFVRIGFAVRSALLVDNRVIEGRNKLAGEIGHVVVPGNQAICLCGKRGCVNASASVPQFLSECERLGIKLTDEFNLTNVRDSDKEHVGTLLMECGSVCGFALAGAMNILAPDTVIISSPYSAFGSEFKDSLVESLSKYCQPEILTQCKLITIPREAKNEALGAAILALQNFPISELLSKKLDSDS